MISSLHLKRCIWILALLSLLVLGDRVLALMLGKMTMSSQIRFSRIYRGGEDADIVVLGNSRGVNAIYAPELERLTNRRVLNLSYNGVSAEIAEALFMDFLERSRQPALVVLELSCLQSDPGTIQDLKAYTGESARLAALYERENRVASGICGIVHLFRYNCELLYRIVYYLKRSDQDWINRYRMSPHLMAAVEASTGERLKISDAYALNFASTNRLIAACRARGIEVRLLVAPYWPAYAAKLAGLREFMADARAGLPADIPIWDYSTALKDSSMFADRVHTNLDGGIALLALLAHDEFFLPQSRPATGTAIAP